LLIRVHGQQWLPARRIGHDGCDKSISVRNDTSPKRLWHTRPHAIGLLSRPSSRETFWWHRPTPRTRKIGKIRKASSAARRNFGQISGLQIRHDIFYPYNSRNLWTGAATCQRASQRCAQSCRANTALPPVLRRRANGRAPRVRAPIQRVRAPRPSSSRSICSRRAAFASLFAHPAPPSSHPAPPSSHPAAPSSHPAAA
jgi:hypothetical protein